MPERDAAERAHELRRGRLRLLAPRWRSPRRCAACSARTRRASEGCPVNIDIKAFIGAIIEGDLPRGVAVLKERNALPAVCGRVCPQEEQCEAVVRARQEGRAGRHRPARALPRRLRPRVRARAPLRARGRRRRAGSAARSSAAARRASPAPASSRSSATPSPSSSRCTRPAACSPTASPSSGCPRTSSPPRSRCSPRSGVEIVTDTVVGQLVTVPELLAEEGFDAVFVGRGAGCRSSSASRARTSTASTRPTSSSRAST